MKYIFLFTLVVVTSGAGAATTMFGDGTLNTTTNQNDVIPSGGFGSAGSSFTDTGTLGGGAFTDTGTLGGGFTDTGTLGGGNGGGTAGERTNRLPDIPKPNQTVAGFVSYFVELLRYVIIALVTAALLVFLYGIFILMFVGGTKEESRSQGRKFMIWGIVSLFVMTSVWGLVSILKTSIFGSGPFVGPTFNI